LNAAPSLPPPIATGGAPKASRLGRWWDRLSIYLPVLMMGLLALASYWVVSQAPKPEPPRPQRPASSEPDYFMQDFAVRTFAADGSLQSELRGAALRHYPGTDRLEVDQVELRSVNPEGRLTTARAQRLLTNDEQSFYTLTGDVVIVREAQRLADGRTLPRLEFRGQALTYFVTEERLESDQPVVMLRGTDRVSADRLRYAEDTRQADLQGRVRATLNPRP
jgi:lipopolysaccharide export system protein LptC